MRARTDWDTFGVTNGETVEREGADPSADVGALSETSSGWRIVGKRGLGRIGKKRGNLRDLRVSSGGVRSVDREYRGFGGIG